MKKITVKSLMFFSAVSLTISATTGLALARGSHDLCYDVTITNITRGQVLTPVLMATHKRGVHLFTAGEPASDELEYLAEAGDVSFLKMDLEGNSRVGEVAVAASPMGPFGPGESVSAQLPVSKRYNRLSLASMLAITNDGIIALDGVSARPGMHVAPVYDAGTEVNDELAANIPGPGGEGQNDADGEGFVHIHAGFHGIGDLPAAELDWRNPAAKIAIDLVRCSDDDE